MDKFEYDSMHGIYGDRFAIDAHLKEWALITERREWRFYDQPIVLLDNGNKSGYERYENRLLKSDDIETLSSDLYVHVVGSLLRKEDEKLLERFAATTSANDRKAKAIALLKVYIFLAVFREIKESNYWRSMEYGDFFDHNFIMLYTYHYLIHAGNDDKLRACGVNYKKFFDEPLIEATEQRLKAANETLKALMSFDYVHPEIVEFYKDYAKLAEMSVPKLENWLNSQIGSTYILTE